jgi:hypothetical protein
MRAKINSRLNDLDKNSEPSLIDKFRQDLQKQQSTKYLMK